MASLVGGDHMASNAVDHVVQKARALINVPVEPNDILANFDDAVLEVITSAVSLSSPCSNESFLFDALMIEISALPVKTIGHIPQSVRPKLAEVLAVEFRNAIYYGIWGFARLFMLAKAVLRCPQREERKNDM